MTRAHAVRTLGMYDASCSVYLVTANRINAVARLAGAHTLLWHTRGALSIIHSCGGGPRALRSDWCPEIPGWIHAAPDVHESPDPLSLFQRRRGWRERLHFMQGIYGTGYRLLVC